LPGLLRLLVLLLPGRDRGRPAPRALQLVDAQRLLAARGLQAHQHRHGLLQARQHHLARHLHARQPSQAGEPLQPRQDERQPAPHHPRGASYFFAPASPVLAAPASVAPASLAAPASSAAGGAPASATALGGAAAGTASGFQHSALGGGANWMACELRSPFLVSI